MADPRSKYELTGLVWPVVHPKGLVFKSSLGLWSVGPSDQPQRRGPATLTIATSEIDEAIVSEGRNYDPAHEGRLSMEPTVVNDIAALQLQRTKGVNGPSGEENVYPRTGHGGAGGCRYRLSRFLRQGGQVFDLCLAWRATRATPEDRVEFVLDRCSKNHRG